MDAASTRELDTPSTSRDSSSHPTQNPLASARLPSSITVGQLAAPGHQRRANATSSSWTSSSGELADISDTDDIDDRSEFVQEYNRVARKYGIRTLESDVRSPLLPGESTSQQKRSWFSRTFLRQSSTTSDASSTISDKKIKNKRSVGDMTLDLMSGTRRDSLKDEDLLSLVRICGRSKLHLPSEYSPGSLVLPTCFRATAQYLVQHGPETRGVFRIPGSVRIVNELYNHYCADGDADEISSTTRCPTLPSHIKAGTHDVASTFKRLLSGLPGGILGSLQLLDAFVAIQSQVDGETESLKTKQPKLRARLIALAIGTVESQLRRNLICAVLGLLCLIGRTAETAPREDEHGNPLPTSDLMGYNALGIVFGPLLMGDLLSTYTTGTADSAPGAASAPASAPVTPPGAKERRKSRVSEESQPTALSIDKIHMANNITEMLILHWRDVVKHMRSLGALKAGRDGSRRTSGVLRPSTSEGFALGMPHPPSRSFASSVSPVPSSPTPGSNEDEDCHSSIVLPRRRPRGMRRLSSGLAGVKASMLSPPMEVPSPVERETTRGLNDTERLNRYSRPSDHTISPEPSRSASRGRPSFPRTPSQKSVGSSFAMYPVEATTSEPQRVRPFEMISGQRSTYLSRPATTTGTPATPEALTRWQQAGRQLRSVSRGANPFRRSLYRDSTTSDSTSHSHNKHHSQESSMEMSLDASGLKVKGQLEEKAVRDDGYKLDVIGRGKSRLAAWRAKRRSLASSSAGSPLPHSPDPEDAKGKFNESETPSKPLRRQHATDSSSSSVNEHRDQPIEARGLSLENPNSNNTVWEFPPLPVGQSFCRDSPWYPDRGILNEASGLADQFHPPWLPTTQRPKGPDPEPSQDVGKNESLSERTTGSRRVVPLGPRPDPSQLALATRSRSKPSKASGSAVKAMAAMFESTSRDMTGHASPGEKGTSRHISRPSGMLSPYTINPSPTKSPSKFSEPRPPTPVSRHTWSPTIHERRLRGSNIAVRRDVATENNSFSQHLAKTREPTSDSSSSARYSISALSRGDNTAMLQYPERSNRKKQPRTPGSRSPSRETGASPSKTPDIPAQREQATPSPYFRQDRRWSNSPHGSSRDEISPASTTRRFPLIPTPEPEPPHQQQGEQQPRASSKIPSRNGSKTPASLNTTTTGVTATRTNGRLTPTGQLHNGRPEPNLPTPGTAAPLKQKESEEPSKLAITLLLHNGADEQQPDTAGLRRELARLRRRELARLREQLSRAEEECAQWRERAERAEGRVRDLEAGLNGDGGGNGGEGEAGVGDDDGDDVVDGVGPGAGDAGSGAATGDGGECGAQGSTNGDGVNGNRDGDAGGMEETTSPELTDGVGYAEDSSGGVSTPLTLDKQSSGESGVLVEGPRETAYRVNGQGEEQQASADDAGGR